VAPDQGASGRVRSVRSCYQTVLTTMTSGDTKDISCIDDWHAAGAFRVQEYVGLSEGSAKRFNSLSARRKRRRFLKVSSFQQALHLEHGTRRIGGLPQRSAFTLLTSRATQIRKP
jgi:hypothetical protein